MAGESGAQGLIHRVMRGAIGAGLVGIEGFRIGVLAFVAIEEV